MSKLIRYKAFQKSFCFVRPNYEIKEIMIKSEERCKQFKVCLKIDYVNLPVEVHHCNDLDAIKKEIQIQMMQSKTW